MTGDQPCPPWCTNAHVPGANLGFRGDHTGPIAAMPISRRTRILIRGIHLEHSAAAEPQVLVIGMDDDADPAVYLKSSDAVAVADLLYMLADAAPADVRSVAAAIRQAAAVITPAGNQTTEGN
jgi:hypothetical protein